MTGPKAPVKEIDLPSWWKPGQPLDFYVAHWQKEEAMRLEILSHAFADGKVNTATRLKRLCRKLHVTPRYVIRLRANAEMTARVKELIKIRAVYGAAEAMTGQIRRAGDDPAAWRTILQVAGVLESGGGGSRVNVAIDARKMGDTDSDKAFFGGFRRRIEATLVDDAETKPQ